MRLQRTRILTTLLVSLVTPPLYALVAWQALSNGTWWVAVGSLIGFALSLWTAWRARRPSSQWRAPIAITVYLVMFLSAVVLTGYGGGYGAAWLVCTPPLALLILGTRRGATITAVMFVVLLVGLLDTAMVSEQHVSGAFRLRLGAAYVVIASTCIAYSAATDWYGQKLSEASEQIKSLRALLTMCSHCKRVRVDGDWRTIESFLDREKQLRFSHGICTHCAVEHYPELQEAPAGADDVRS